MNTFNQPFYRYSRRNRQGHKPVAASFHIREKALNMWFQQFTADEIAATLHISTEAVKVYVRKARESGDERAADRRTQMRELKAKTRRRDIISLRKTGMTPREIAEFLCISRSLVLKRLQEARACNLK